VRPCVYLVFPQFCARSLATPRPRAGVCRRKRRKPSRGLQRFAIGSLSSIGITYYHAAYLAGTDMSSAASSQRGSVRAHKVEDSANTPTAARLSSETDGQNKVHLADAANDSLVLRMTAGVYARDKNRLYVRQILLLRNVCQTCRSTAAIFLSHKRIPDSCMRISAIIRFRFAITDCFSTFHMSV